jgi:ubiquitin-conjugating enzyme E2 D/E
MSTERRLRKEIQDMQSHPPDNCSAKLVKDQITNKDILTLWEAQITGPENTPFQNGIFKLTINFGTNYPFKPPQVKFTTKVFHPNIDKSGNICLDILKDQWSPALSMSKVLLSISSLLMDPNPDDPLDAEAAELYKRDIDEYYNKIKTFTETFAK